MPANNDSPALDPAIPLSAFGSLLLLTLLGGWLSSSSYKAGFGEGYMQCVAERPTADMENPE